jgi:S1-C subfamily serine protease
MLISCGIVLPNLLAIAVVSWVASRSSSRPGAVPAPAPELRKDEKKEQGHRLKRHDQPEEKKQLQAVVPPKPPAPVPVPPAIAPVPEPRVLTTPEIVARSEASVALIKGRLESGTGFIAGPGLLATNAHVVAEEPIRTLEIHFPSAPVKDRGPMRARLLYQDSRRDLALMAVETTLPALELSRSHVFNRGEDVTIIGCPAVGGAVLLNNAVSRGVVSTEVRLGGQRFFQLGAAVNHGNSGGPALNSHGQVIGVVTAKAAAEESIGFCIPVEDLISALDKIGAPTPDGVVRVEKQHDLESILRRLRIAGRANADAIEHYLSLMVEAQKLGESPAGAVMAARQMVETRLVALNRKLTEGIPAEIGDHVADIELAFPIRRDLSDLWRSFATLRDFAEKPRGNLRQFLLQSRAAQRSFQDRLESLKRTLGADLED